jgi:two-component system response regulator HydG
MSKILIIDDNINICQLLARFLTRNGHAAEYCTTGAKGLEVMISTKFDLVLCDFRLPDTDGREILHKVKTLYPGTQVIIITGYSDVKIAVDVIKMGAIDYVTKPLLPEEILLMVEKAARRRQEASTQNEMSSVENISTVSLPEVSEKKITKTNLYPEKKYIAGNSKESKNIERQVELVAPTNYSVIIYGESGTGKEPLAFGIHSKSNRKDKPFIAVDCGALTKELAGSELFGHEKGSFTGAIQSKVGQFELANGGTIFLDEIANLSYEIQVSLLRVIQERKIRRIGSQKETEIDVRIIVASNERLNEAAANGKFREDLFHRFNEFSINLSPLRERKEDLMLFADYFLELANQELGRNIEGFETEVINIFMEYNWPGNLREMNNVIKRAALLTAKNLITSETLPQEIIFQSKFNVLEESDNLQKNPNSKKSEDLKSITISAEYEKIIEVLRKVNFNKTKAAQILNIDRKTLYNKMNSYNMKE